MLFALQSTTTFSKPQTLRTCLAISIAAATATLLFLYYPRSNRQNLRSEPPKRKNRKLKQTSRAIYLTGLRNLGNTCYLNSILQFLSASDCIIDELNQINGNNNNNNNNVFSEFKGLLNELRKPGERVLSAARFLRALCGTNGNNSFSLEQQDAHEFLIAILTWLNRHPSPNNDNSLHRSSPSSSSSKSIITTKHSYEGVLLYELHCSKCRKYSASITLTSFSVLTLPLAAFRYCPEPIELEDLLAKECGGLPSIEYFNDYRVNEHDSCTADKGAFRYCKIRSLPQCLLLHLPRHDAIHNRKLDIRVNCPASLKLQSICYDLKAVIEHIGTGTHGGHYICWVRRPDSSWYSYSDDTVNRSKTDLPFDQSRVYLLLYERHSSL